MDQLSSKSKQDFANFLSFFLADHFLNSAINNVNLAIKDSHSFYAFIFNKFINNENKGYKFLSNKVRAKYDKDSVFLESENSENKLYIQSLALPIELDRMLGTEHYLNDIRYRPIFDDFDFANLLTNKNLKYRQRHEIQDYLFDRLILNKFFRQLISMTVAQIGSSFDFLLYLQDEESIFLADCLKVGNVHHKNFDYNVKFYAYDSVCSREQLFTIINGALARNGHSNVDEILNIMLNENSSKQRLFKSVAQVFDREIEGVKSNFDISSTIHQYVLSRFLDLSESKNAIDFTSWCLFACLCSKYLEISDYDDPNMKRLKGISANSKIILDILSYDSNKSWLNDMFSIVNSNWGKKFKYTNENTYMGISPKTDLDYLKRKRADSTSERITEFFLDHSFYIFSMFDFSCDIDLGFVVKFNGFLLYDNCNYVYMGSYNTRYSSTLILYNFFSMGIVRSLLKPFCKNLKEAVIVVNLENL